MANQYIAHKLPTIARDGDDNIYDDKKRNTAHLGVSGLRLMGREIHVLHRTAGWPMSESTSAVGGMSTGVEAGVVDVGSM